MNKNTTKKISKVRFRFYGAVLFLCLTILAGCKKKEDTLGMSVYPEDEQLGLLTTDTITVLAKTVSVDSVRTDDLTIGLLGSYVDPVFGQTKAALTLQVQPSTNSTDFGDLDSLTVDSVILSLVYSDYYGDQGPIQFEAFQIDEELYKDSSYYSTSSFNVLPDNILDKVVYTPNYKGTSPESANPEKLMFKFSTDIGFSMIEQASVSSSTFLEEFKGIHLRVADVFADQQPEGKGALWYFDMENINTKLTVYYTQPDSSSSYDFILDEDLTRVNHFEHDYSGTEIEQALADSLVGNTNLYIQGAAGVAVEIQIPYLENLIEKGPVSVNKAELVFSIEENTYDDYTPEYQYQMLVKTESGGYSLVLDDFDSHIDVGGIFGTDGKYRFVINRDIQYLLNQYVEGNDYNNGYRLTNVSPAIQVSRAILKGTKTGESEAKLIVSYTPL